MEIIVKANGCFYWKSGLAYTQVFRDTAPHKVVRVTGDAYTTKYWVRVGPNEVYVLENDVKEVINSGNTSPRKQGKKKV